MYTAKLGKYCGLVSVSEPPRIISDRPRNASKRNIIYLEVTFSPKIGPAKQIETRGAQFRTIIDAVSEKYFVAINTANIAKLPETTLIANGLTQELSIESYIKFLRLLLW